MDGLVARALGSLAALALALAVLAGADQPAHADVSAARVAGEDRYETAALIAEATWDPADNTFAVVARADDYPDALAGAGAAAAVGAPILLVDHDEVPERTAEALESLTIASVVILGGEAAVGPLVEDELAADYDVQRIGGGDRYGTAAEIASFLDAHGGIGPVLGDTGAILVSGENFADALTAGPLAYSGRLPILLTLPEQLPDVTAQALEDLGIGHVIILGGSAAVSESVEEEVAGGGVEITRFGGQRRTDTAALFADAVIDTWGYSASTTMIARGDDFPDALAAGPRGGSLEAPILLTASPTSISEESRAWLRERCPDVDLVQAIGGTEAVTDGTLEDAVVAAEACLGPSVVASFQTDLLGDPDRTHNIHLAADYVDGDVIRPGESYSLNANIGQRTVARGFRNVEGGCIGAGGEAVDCVGGGVSQFATTFMNAAWLAGIEIPEFHPHSLYFRRYPVCHEATLSWGTLDVVVRNDSPYDITVDAFYDTAVIGVQLLSQPWADVTGWSDPTPETAPDQAFTSTCGRTITYPDGSTREEAYEHHYDGTGF